MYAARAELLSLRRACVCVWGGLLLSPGSWGAHPAHLTRRGPVIVLLPANAKFATVFSGFILPQSLCNGLWPLPHFAQQGNRGSESLDQPPSPHWVVSTTQAVLSAWWSCGRLQSLSLSEHGVWGGGAVGLSSGSSRCERWFLSVLGAQGSRC